VYRKVHDSTVKKSMVLTRAQSSRCKGHSMHSTEHKHQPEIAWPDPVPPTALTLEQAALAEAVAVALPDHASQYKGGTAHHRNGVRIIVGEVEVAAAGGRSEGQDTRHWSSQKTWKQQPTH
jgi:hypothetical protein